MAALVRRRTDDMLNTFPRRAALVVFFLFCVVTSVAAQPAARKLLQGAPGQSAQARGQSVAATRHILATVDTQALAFDRIELALFDDVQVTARRTSRSHARPGSTVWYGKLEAPDRGEVTLVDVNGALAGSVTANGRMFEIGFAGRGLHEV